MFGHTSNKSFIISSNRQLRGNENFFHPILLSILITTELLIDLYQAVCDGDLHRARRIQERVSLLKEAVYANEEPSGDAHARMKAAMMMSGRFRSATTRPPTRAPSSERLDKIQAALRKTGLLSRAEVVAEPVVAAPR